MGAQLVLETDTTFDEAWSSDAEEIAGRMPCRLCLADNQGAPSAKMPHMLKIVRIESSLPVSGQGHWCT